MLHPPDINHDALASYAAYFPNATVLKCDIRDLCPSSLPRDVDILLGGPPCQGFSSAGQQFWDDPRNKLLAEYVRILDAIRPKWFLMENVEGLLTAWKGQYLCECVKAMLSLGYNVSLEKLYAHAYGIPQRRKRVVMVGNRLGHIFKFPPASHNISGAIFRKSEATFAQATSDLPPAITAFSATLEYAKPPENELQEMLRTNTLQVTQHFHLTQRAEQLARIEMLKPGQTMKDLPAKMQHASFRRRANRRVCDGTPTEKRGGAPSGIKRLFSDEPALTITGAAMREFVHPTEHRTLSLRECARLQTFPDDFHFCGSMVSALQQIANAVPPLLAERIGCQIKDEFGFTVAYTPERPHLEFRLTQSNGMSPALRNTELLLKELVNDQEKQLQLFEETRRYITS
jgi:DNA (cytosine-5)-methyltransferase 1